MLSLLVLSFALADDAPPAAPDPDAPSSEEPPPESPPAAPSTPARAPTVRQPTTSRSSLGTLRLFGSTGDPAAQALTYGSALGIAYGAFLGGGTSYAVFGEEAEAISGGVLLGGAAGGIAGYAAVKAFDPSPDRVLKVGSTAGYGAFLGYETARFFIAPGAEEEARRIEAAGVLGSVAGLGVGMLGQRVPEGEVMLRADLGLGAGFLAGTAICSLAGLDMYEDRSSRAPITTLSTTALGGVALAFASSDLPQPGAASMVLGLTQGGWIGLWTPVLLGTEPGAGRGWAGARLGLGAGYLASYGVAAFGEPDLQSLGLQLGGIASGNALGAGLPLLLGTSDDARPVIGSMLGFGVAGQVGAAVAANHLEETSGDLLLAGTMGSWGLWQSAGWGVVAADVLNDDARGVGAGLTLSGAVGLGTIALMATVDLQAEESALMLSAGGWASGLTALAGAATNAERAKVLSASLVAGDVAFAGTAAALGSGVQSSWGTVARVNGGMAVGGALGALGTVIFAYDSAYPWRVPVATVAGSGLGLGVALALPRRQAPTLGWARGPILPRPHLPRLPVHAGFSVGPWLDDDGGQGASVTVQGVIGGG